ATLHSDPLSPPPRRRRLPADLEACCLKALEKEAQARYPSLQALADDLKRWLEGRPLLARPLSVAERLTRWCRKNRLVACLSGILALLLTVAAIAGPVLAWRFRELAPKATNEAEEAKKARKLELAARLATEQSLIDTYTEAGLATAAKGQAGEAILWFANAAARSELHPLRLRHNQVRFQSWLP